jgi:hypothetical protein
VRIDACPESVADYETARLERYAAAWLIWRSERFDGEPAAWCATRRDRTAGEPYTVARDSARELAARLAEQVRADQLKQRSVR